jgi:diguanylate cyclase (GGDEF)-like protein
MFDLDHFKAINDRFGHAVGDDALRLFARIVGGNLRDHDIVARFGGEEFVAMLPGSIADAMIAAERVRLAFEAAGRAVGVHNLDVTVSVGAATGAAHAEVEDLIGNADAALYRAKLNGRNRVEKAHGGPLLVATPFAPARAAA